MVALSLWFAHQGTSVTFDTAGHVVEMGEPAAAAREMGEAALYRPVFDASGDTADRYVGDGSLMRRSAELARLRLRSLAELVRATAADLVSDPQRD